MNVTEHFRLEEFWATSATAARLGIDNAPPPEALTNLLRLATELEKVRAILELPIEVLSGYRCSALNAAVGGVPTSYHQLGCAVDFHPPGGTSFADMKTMIAAMPEIAFDELLEEHAGDGGHWLHLQIAKPEETPRRRVLTAELDHMGGAISRVTVG